MLTTFFQGDSIEPGQAKRVAARAQISAYLEALRTYKKETGDYPSTSQGLEALRTNPGIAGWDGPYVDKDIAPDAWGHAFLYRYRADGIPEIVSLGREGRPGPSNISSLTLNSRPKASSRPIALLRTGMSLILAIGFMVYPLLPPLLRKQLNSRTRAC
jgi:type II secretion system protein G